MRGSSFASQRRVLSFCFFILAAFLIPGPRTSAAPQSALVFAPERFTRAAGPPVVEVRQFSVAPPVEGPFTLTIVSGEPDPYRPGGLANAARGFVVLNGLQVIGPHDFGKHGRIDRAVALQANNVLEVKLVGATGTHLTLSIAGVVNLSISAITPDNGPVGTPVLISGSGFDPVPSNNQVSFNGAAAAVLNATTTAIQTVVPEGATTGPITVTTPNGSATSTPFTVTSGNVLLISKSPDQPIYSRGQPITITAVVVDRHGQPVPNAVVTLASDPVEDGRAGNTFVYQSDGTFTIGATAEASGETLIASLALTVQGQGPAIACTDPFDGEMLNVSPGSVVTLRGTVNSVNGISQFTVNGSDVTVLADGEFATSITTTFGVNMVDLAVVDAVGLATRRTCSFMVSSTWAVENQVFADTVSFKALQSSLDDGIRSNGLRSFADLLHSVVNSEHPANTLDAALTTANPLKPSACDEEIGTIFGTICVLRSSVVYSSLQLGPANTSLSLVNGGISSDTRFQGAVIRLRVIGEQVNIPFDVTGDVIFEFVDVHAIFDTFLAGGRPHVGVRPNSVTANVGSTFTNFPGLDGAVLDDIVIPLAQGFLRDLVRDVLRNYTLDNFRAVLDGVISSLDVSLPPTYQVQALSAAPPVTLGFAINFSSLTTTTSRMLFGIGTRLQGPTAQSRVSLGAPIRPGTVGLDPVVSAPNTLAAAFHEGFRGQALHALWRAGYFDAVFSGGAFGGAVPAGASLRTVALLPPVPMIRSDGRAEFAIGAMQIRLEHPGLVPNPLDGSLGGRVACATTLVGDALQFTGCGVDELHFAPEAQLDSATTNEVEAILADVLSEMLRQAAHRALPELPIPGFGLPAFLSTYQLPSEGVFGLVAPSLSTQQRHFLLRGALGIR